MTVQQLVIRNLSILEQAPAIADEINKAIMRAVQKRMKDCVERWPDWRVVDDNETGGIWSFGPTDWPCDPGKIKDKEKNMAYYILGTTIKDGTNGVQWDISALTGAVAIEYGIWFEVNTPWMTHLAGKGARPTSVWERFLASQVSDNRILQSKGFRLIDADLFLPIRIAADDLANAYPDTLDDALTPVDDAMAKLKEAHPEIDAIIKAAEDQFRVPAPTLTLATTPDAL